MAEEEQQRESRRQDDLEIKGPLGWSLRASGKQVTWMIVVVVMMGAFFWMLREHDLQAKEAVISVAAAQKVDLQAVATQQGRMQESIEAMLYILSLSQEEKAKLKLDMPPGLRTRLLNQERPR